jgi:hypothetical protein
MKKKLLVGLALGMMMLGISGVANATLIGDTITATGIDLSPSSATIGDGVEFVGLGSYINFDFGASTLTISPIFTGVLNWGGYGNYVFSDFDETITGVTIASNTGFNGEIVDSFSFDADSITLDMTAGRSSSVPSVLVFNIATQTAPVPEPATMLLFGTGLASLVGARLRRKK